MDAENKPAMPAIAMQPVQSSMLAVHGYDASSRTLAVEFKGGGTYHYTDVPPEVVADMLAAGSIGGFFAKNIRGKFTSTKLEKPKGE